ncbi:hypothetical protein [Microcystis aeruginosa]|uniref:hypothetical protein n=1 Tax=Microcystis aeruginosa TaxID=1126 RepID=UPI001882BA9E|nr:hypothetical protein [Microcystis aeruginosa]MBE8995668.1 hypothetical protein [Microcystis aeruginosa LEGE 91341]
MKNLQPLDLHPIKTESEYEAALLEIESLLEVPPGTPEAARLDLLATLPSDPPQPPLKRGEKSSW